MEVADGRVTSGEARRAEEAAYSFYSGQILQDARKEAKMTQNELAERTQATKSYISKIENGVITPSVGVFYRIIAALGMNTTEYIPLTTCVKASYIMSQASTAKSWNPTCLLI